MEVFKYEKVSVSTSALFKKAGDEKFAGKNKNFKKNQLFIFVEDFQ